MTNKICKKRVWTDYKGGRGYWTVFYISSQRFLFDDLTFLGTEFLLAGSVSWVSKRFNH